MGLLFKSPEIFLSTGAGLKATILEQYNIMKYLKVIGKTGINNF